MTRFSTPGSWVGLAGVAGLTALAACGPAPSNVVPAAASAGAPPITAAPARYACLSVKDGRPVECILDAASGAAGVQQLSRACGASPGQVFAQSCPSEGLIGCCTIPYTDGTRREVCYYPPVRSLADPQTCAGDGGAWSTQP